MRRLPRGSWGKDVPAGLVLGVESIPDGLAGGLLAGVNPIFRLYGSLFGTLFGAMATSSAFMAVQATGAMAVVVSDIDAVQGESAEAATGLVTLAVSPVWSCSRSAWHGWAGSCAGRPTPC